MTTKKETAMDAVAHILRAARGADCIVTVCPMCQMNLEAFQKKISRREGENLSISILYLPQLMGFAFGMGTSELKTDMNFVFKPELRQRLQAGAGRAA